MKVTIYFSIVALLLSGAMHAQVGINTDNAAPAASAMLDVKSTTKGMLIPRMTTTQRNAITTPAAGLMIYNSTDNEFNYYNGTAWLSVGKDNLGNHTATQAIITGSHLIRHDATNTSTIELGTTGMTVEANSARPAHFISSSTDAANAAYIEVNNNVGTRALFGPDGSGLSGGATNDVAVANWSNGDLTFFTNAAERVRIDNVGNMGIGITPLAKLHVSGTTRMDGTATINGTTTINSAGNALSVVGANSTNNVIIREEYTNAGAISMYNNTGAERWAQFIDTSTDVAALFAYGPNSSNLLVGNLSGFSDHGYIAVGDAASGLNAGMYIDAAGNGIVYGNTKSFRIDHPEDDSKEIWYACIEGPEAAAYVRGTAQLVDGKAIIPFPDHFKLVANEETLTVTLTPQSADSKGLAVVKKSDGGFEVRELSGGTGSYSFDWVAMAVRVGHEDFKVIREKKDLIQQKRVAR